MGRDSATFQDKGTVGQAQNLTMARDWPGQPVNIWDGTRDGTIAIFLSNSGTGHGTGRDNHYIFPIISCFRTSFCPGMSRRTSRLLETLLYIFSYVSFK